MKKKLIEVALPLEAINREAAREKSLRHGHPSTLHLWWARRPLAACRAVIFASIIDDPSSDPDQFPTEADQDLERQRLFRIIEDLVKWENSTDASVMDRARAEIRRATGGAAPTVLDPFCGGGTIPLEAQRLGLSVEASDLNPVAVLLTKALVEIPPVFRGRPPVNGEQGGGLKLKESWVNAQGLADDVRFYGQWIRNEAEARIGHWYPKVRLPDGEDRTVIAWLWARTIKCINPACGGRTPVIRSFLLANRGGQQTWVEPQVDSTHQTVAFAVRSGVEPNLPPATKTRGSVRCIFCGDTSLTEKRLREHATTDPLTPVMFAVIAEATVGQAYVDPDPRVEPPAREEAPEIDLQLSDNARWFSPPAYGLGTFSSLFTHRQLKMLQAFSDLVGEARDRVLQDAEVAGLPRDGRGLEDGGDGADAYADAVAVYLALAVDRLADRHSSLTRWDPNPSGYAPKIGNTFGRQALPMVWDFPEANPFSAGSGNASDSFGWVAKVLENVPAMGTNIVSQLDARALGGAADERLVCTDPPYYDNIGYADLSDYFYIWLRRSLKGVMPNLLSTLLVPKSEELIASPHRFGNSRVAANQFFEHGLRESFGHMRSVQAGSYPLCVFYAFKQTETRKGSDGINTVVSTGWETMLEGLLSAGLGIHGTWPMRSELSNRLVASGTNALASSIVLVCRVRDPAAPVATKREYLSSLREVLPHALRDLQHGNIAPVDLAQAAIGPGMAVFSQFAKVFEADGSQMPVRAALALINQVLDEVVAEQEGEFDSDTRFAITWFEQRGTSDGAFGEADVLARAKNTSVDGLVNAGVLAAQGGKVRLLRREEMPDEWDPATDTRPTIWEAAQHLTRRLEQRGEMGAAELLRRLGGAYGSQARDLAYRLYLICERKAWAQEALAYNALVVAWAEIARHVVGTPEAGAQAALDI